LVCAECGQHYVIRTPDYYGCASKLGGPAERLHRRREMPDSRTIDADPLATYVEANPNSRLA
jgi:hypothetical protein